MALKSLKSTFADQFSKHPSVVQQVRKALLCGFSPMHIDEERTIASSQKDYSGRRHTTFDSRTTSGQVQRRLLSKSDRRPGVSAESVLTSAQLSGMHLFSELDEKAAEELRSKFTIQEASDGDYIVQYKSRKARLYIILSGEVRVAMPGDSGGQKIVSTLYVGDHFGEISLLTNNPATAHIIANGDVKLAYVDAKDLEYLGKRFFGQMRKVAEERKSIGGALSSELEMFSYCPDILLKTSLKAIREGRKKITEKDYSTFQGTILFPDICGYTALSEKLADETEDAASILASSLSNYLRKIIHIIKEFDGDVFKFCGDALKVIFKSPNEMIESSYNAVCAALKIQHHAALCLIRDVHLRIKCGLVSGEYTVDYLNGSSGRSVVMVHGLSLAELDDVIKECSEGDTIVSPNTFAWLQSCVKASSTSSTELVFERTKLKNYRIYSLPECVLTRSEIPAASLVYSMSTMEMVNCSDVIRPYLQRVLRRNIDDGLRCWNHDLVREISTIFININVHLPSERNLLQPIFDVVDSACKDHGGHVRQMVVDDKGVVCICSVGLISTGEDALNSVRCALEIHDNMQKLCSCSIGVARGRVFVGSLGGNVRRDYVLMGDSVNLSARLMGKASAKSEILVDRVTRDKTQHQLKYSKAIKLRVKGKKEILEVFSLSGTSDHLERLFQETRDTIMLGRDEYLERYKIEIESFEAGVDKLSIFITGASGMGKTLMVNTLRKDAEQRGFLVYNFDQKVHKNLSGWKKLYEVLKEHCSESTVTKYSAQKKAYQRSSLLEPNEKNALKMFLKDKRDKHSGTIQPIRPTLDSNGSFSGRRHRSDEAGLPYTTSKDKTDPKSGNDSSSEGSQPSVLSIGFSSNGRGVSMSQKNYNFSRDKRVCDATLDGTIHDDIVFTLSQKQISACIVRVLAAYINCIKEPFFFVLDDLDSCNTDDIRMLILLVQKIDSMVFVFSSKKTKRSVTNMSLLSYSFKSGMRMKLTPFDQNICGKILKAALRLDDLPNELMEKIYSVALGNPTHWIQLVTSLISSDNIELSESLDELDGKRRIVKYTLEGAMFESIEKFLIKQIDSLKPQDREILQCGAIIGTRFDFELLKFICPDHSVTKIRSCMKHAMKLGCIKCVVHRTNTYQFVNEEMKEILYTQCIAKARRILHHKIAVWYERQLDWGDLAGSPFLAKICWHYEASQSYVEDLFGTIILGRRAIANSHFQSALLYLSHALDLTKLIEDDYYSRLRLSEMSFILHLFWNYRDVANTIFNPTQAIVHCSTILANLVKRFAHVPKDIKNAERDTYSHCEELLNSEQKPQLINQYSILYYQLQDSLQACSSKSSMMKSCFLALNLYESYGTSLIHAMHQTPRDMIFKTLREAKFLDTSDRLFVLRHLGALCLILAQDAHCKKFLAKYIDQALGIFQQITIIGFSMEILECKVVTSAYCDVLLAAHAAGSLPTIKQLIALKPDISEVADYQTCILIELLASRILIACGLWEGVQVHQLDDSEMGSHFIKFNFHLHLIHFMCRKCAFRELRDELIYCEKELVPQALSTLHQMMKQDVLDDVSSDSLQSVDHSEASPMFQAELRTLSSKSSPSEGSFRSKSFQTSVASTALTKSSESLKNYMGWRRARFVRISKVSASPHKNHTFRDRKSPTRFDLSENILPRIAKEQTNIKIRHFMACFDFYRAVPELISDSLTKSSILQIYGKISAIELEDLSLSISSFEYIGYIVEICLAVNVFCQYHMLFQQVREINHIAGILIKKIERAENVPVASAYFYLLRGFHEYILNEFKDEKKTSLFLRDLKLASKIAHQYGMRFVEFITLFSERKIKNESTDMIGKFYSNEAAAFRKSFLPFYAMRKCGTGLFKMKT
eukprot:g2647.t1